MSRSDVAVRSHQIDAPARSDDDPRGLSVAEIQQAFRELRRSREGRGASAASVSAPAGPRRSHTGDSCGPDTAWHVGVAPPQPFTQPARATDAGYRLGTDWTVVVSAHGGAGASCVALAIADALSASQQPSRLIETAPPARSGLVAAATAELGADPTGAWRRGTRQRSTLYRPATDVPPAGWPAPAGSVPTATVVDLGLPTPADLSRLATDRPQLVVVCRGTVPGLRAAEQLLAELDGVPAVLAAVGAGRWPGAVSASLGPAVRDLRAAGQVVTVPADRHLQLTGPTTRRLPTSVGAAGRALLDLIDTARPGRVNPPAPPAPRTRGTRR